MGASPFWMVSDIKSNARFTLSHDALRCLRLGKIVELHDSINKIGLRTLSDAPSRSDTRCSDLLRLNIGIATNLVDRGLNRGNRNKSSKSVSEIVVDPSYGNSFSSKDSSAAVLAVLSILILVVILVGCITLCCKQIRSKGSKGPKPNKHRTEPVQSISVNIL
ncbi:hypothetical protein FSP39_003679 [Pinctada imbricata]|uniref:Uncharacterized protein n=1 Tax=Pinctada imbricata TaxID=66713 RepID=A0AA88YCD4_PINIB|nr:hypothetical protein FSP39_003679 [Pinctada imbricata]